MHLYFSEFHDKGTGIIFKIKKEVYSAVSPYQEIKIFDTCTYGRLLVLDGLVMLTEKDEFVYHEMLVHPAFSFKSVVKKAGVIGGGDGGTIREILKYRDVEEAYLIEIDRMVVEASKKYLPFTASSLKDERVKIFFEDGIRFLNVREEGFDLLFVDSSDPVGPAKALYSKEFYESIRRNLKEDGIVVFQSESPWYHLEIIKKQIDGLSEFFNEVRLYFAPVPTYPGGFWSFTMATNKKLKKQRDFIPPGLRYFNESVRENLFWLPEFVKNVTG